MKDFWSLHMSSKAHYILNKDSGNYIWAQYKIGEKCDPITGIKPEKCLEKIDQFSIT